MDAADIETLSTTKKRNLSQVSRTSISPSPPVKMANKETSMLMENMSPGLDVNKLESMSDMDTDTASLHSKMDTMMVLMKQMMQSFTQHQVSTTEEFQKLKDENQHLQLRLAEAEGKMTRMNLKIATLRDKCEDLHLRSMSRNILIYNIKEQEHEDIYAVVYDVLSNKLKIPDNYIHSERNPTAPVQVDIAHRIGKPGHRVRPIVVQLVLRRGKELIFRYVKNLKDMDISISEQLPPEMRERREVQFSHFKHLRDQYKHDSSKRVRLTRDKLFVNNKLVPCSFETNTLQMAKDQGSATFKYDDLAHTKTYEHSLSYFQGHVHKVKTIAEANASLAALLQNPDVAKAHHISYAYSITNETENDCIIGQSDDGETGASDILKTIIQERGLTNIFLSVSRCHNGPNLGKKRFEIIRATVLDALLK